MCTYPPNMMSHVPILSRILDFVGISRFTLHALLFVGVIAPPQGFASSEMALIPAGSFQMGSDNGRPNETPAHQVLLVAFYTDKYETTNADYREFVLANPRWRKLAVKARDYLRHWDGNDFPAGMDRYPVTYITHEAAQAYCEWRGKRLPTEAEWEKAAQGGQLGQLYPWGNQVNPDAANYDSRDVRSGGLKNMQRYLKPVGHFPPNGHTLYNMGGNVAEWCADRYLPHYRESRQDRDSQQSVEDSRFRKRRNDARTSEQDAAQRTLPAKGPFVVRGGSWFDSVFDLRCAARAYALSGAYYHIGFRCVKSKD